MLIKYYAILNVAFAWTGWNKEYIYALSRIRYNYIAKKPVLTPPYPFFTSPQINLKILTFIDPPTHTSLLACNVHIKSYVSPISI